MGWTKATELAKVARRDGRGSIVQPGCTKRRELPKEEFKREVSKHLTGKETEPWEILYFKVYKSQLPVIEQALETAGSDAGERQVARLLPGDDLCGFSGGSELGDG